MVFNKDKRGFLLAEETLKIIIALIAIVFLAYFLVQIYLSKVNGDKLQQAEALLIDSQESLEILMNNVGEGNSLSRTVIEPEGWYIFSFSGEMSKPNSCSGENCVCICDNALWDGFDGTNQQEKCDDGGACLAQSDLGEFGNIKITGDLKIINVTKIAGEIYLIEDGS